MNDYNKDGSPTMRTLASINNPLIGGLPGDTYNNVLGMIGLLQDLSIYEPEMHLSRPATSGFFSACEVIKAAIQFEAGIEGEE